MPELSTASLSKTIGGRLHFGSMPPLGGGYEPVRRIVTEVEKVVENDVYWALPGREQLAEQAFLRGALGVVVCGRYVEPWAGKFSIEVDDSRQALQQLARRSRRQLAGKLIAVSGGLGKSITKQTIDSLLASTFVGGQHPAEDRFDRVGSLLELARVPPTDDFGTLEVSCRLLGHAAEFLATMQPDMAVLTSQCLPEAGQQSFACDATESEAFITSLRQASVVIANGDDDGLRRMALRLGREVVFTGRHGADDFSAQNVGYRNGVLSFVIENHSVKTRVNGRHCLNALLLAYGVARTMGMSPGQIAASMPDRVALPSRCQVEQLNQLTIIDDSYHSTPVSLQASLNLLNETSTNGRRILVCGDIAVDATRPCHVHRLLANAAVTRYRCDGLVTCGTYAKEMQSAAQEAGLPANAALAFHNVDDVIQQRQSWVSAGDAVLVAGHRMSGMKGVVDSLKDPTLLREGIRNISRVA